MSSMPTIKSREITIAPEVPISKTMKFWEGLRQGKIFATRCTACGKVYFPPNTDCAECLLTDLEWIELTGEAEVETFTHVVVRPTTFQQYKPYTVAIGKFTSGVKVLAWLTGFKLSEIKVGLKIKLTAKTSPEGNPTYEFVPP